MRFLVVGLGSFGSRVARFLFDRGHDVLGVDLDPERVERLAAVLPDLWVGDASRPEVLEEAGARDAEMAVISTGDDIVASVLIGISLRDLGLREIHVKVVSDLQGRILAKVGIEDTVFPERETAELLARRLESRSLARVSRIAPGLSAQEVALPDSWIGRSLRDLDLPRRRGILVLGLRHEGSEELRLLPEADTPLREGDWLLVAGPDESLERLAAE